MKKPVLTFQRLWSLVTAIGITDQISANEKKYIKFTNVITILTVMAVFLYIPLSIFERNYFLAALQTVDALFILSALILNYFHYHTASRYAYLAVVNAFVYINSCFIGFESHVHDFFYISYIIPFLLFSVRDYKNIVCGALIAIFFFYIYNHTYQHFTRYNVDGNIQRDIYGINLWMKFVLFGLAIYILSYYNFTTESELAASNRKLQEQAQELKRSNEDLEQFAFIISHDLKAPVRGISGFMTLLKRRYADTLDAPALEFIDLSQSSAERMSTQIEDLLSYSKLGRDLPSTTTVDINTTVRIIEMELGQKFKETNARVIIEQELPKLHDMHQSMVHHVFQNLIANGVKFNVNEKPEVRISYTAGYDDYTFQIRDNGIGIDCQYKDKLFQMFKRLHNDTAFEGTGIGLAVCKKIVNFYGGDIWFESEPGKGTSFFFSLPNHQPVSNIFRTKFTQSSAAAIAVA